MPPSDDLRAELQRVYQGRGFVSDLAIALNPQRGGFELLIQREYGRVVEGLDLEGGAAWVKWRQAMQGCE